MENPDPPPPQIKDGKMARFCSSRAFILDLGGGGMGVCCSILFCPRLYIPKSQKMAKKIYPEILQENVYKPQFYL